MKTILYVFEFADDAGAPLREKSDALWGLVQARLESLNPGIRAETAGGIFRRAGGNGFAFKRVCNFFYMHLSSAFRILFSRADAVFVRTTPPLIQLSYAFWCGVFRRKKILWLMDYHPVFGVRTTPKKSLANRVWRVLDSVDRLLLKKFDLVVCLDEAMRELVKERAPNVETAVCPTFSLKAVEWLDLRKEPRPGEPLRLLYSGNLGKSHSVGRLEELLKLLADGRGVEFSYCGASGAAADVFARMCSRCGAKFKRHAFVENYGELGEFYKREGFDFGVVLLNDELKGVVSPSKFSGYSAFGLPIIYIGPRGTNADIACRKFGAGLSADSDAGLVELAEAALRPDIRNACASATKRAAEYFSPNAANALAEILDEFMRRS